MIPGRKHIAASACFLLALVIAFLTQSIIATHHNHHQQQQPNHQQHQSSQFDEEEIIDVFAPVETSNFSEGNFSASSNRPGNSNSQLTGKADSPLFAWRRLPTNRCSKSCGKGFRLHHLSCIDLKFNVRVEEKLCEEQRNLIKPEELGDEPCNQLDCPPEWASIEYRECSPPPSKAEETGANQTKFKPECQLNVYKRVQCMMVDRSGKSIQLPDSSCNNHTSANKDSSSSSSGNSDFEKDVEITLDEDEEPATALSSSEASGNERSNDISPSNRDRDDEDITYLHDAPSSGPSSNAIQPATTILDGGQPSEEELDEGGEETRQQSSRRINNEPFYELGTWSECSAPTCGQLGKRIRMVSCRLYLVKSTKFVELPVSSCQHLPAPDVQEPCYLDCIPPTQPPQPESTTEQHQSEHHHNHHHEQHNHHHLHHHLEKKIHDISGLAQLIENNEQTMNETISDLEAMRYTWKMIKQKLKLIQ